MRQTLIIMVKEPRPGQVKTRLGRDIGMVAAAWWYRWQIQVLIRRLSDARWRLVLAVTPDTEGLNSRIWPRNVERMAQGSGDLGDRMLRMMLAAPKGPVCLIGSDIPDVVRTHIARAFDDLGRNEAVFGPALDGGFWLIGLKRSGRVSRKMFQDVRWSTKHALADSLANMIDMRVALVDTLQDVDTSKDLSPNVAIARDV